MKETEVPFTPEESLRVISKTIERAKRRVQESGFYLLLWGTLVVAAGLLDFYQGLQIPDAEHKHRAWLLVPLVGIVATIIYEVRRQRAPLVERNTFNDLYAMIWLGYGITLPMLIAYTVRAELSPTPLILAITGFALFMSGQVLHFRPLAWGAVVIWAGALCSLFAAAHWHSLIIAVATGIGYLVPGYLLNRAKRA